MAKQVIWFKHYLLTPLFSTYTIKCRSQKPQTRVILLLETKVEDVQV